MSDPWYPGATKRPIPEADAQSFITPRLAILHTNGSPNSTRSLYSYWARGDVGNESHFQVALDGTAEQYMPVNRRGDCNSAANSFELGGVRYGAVSFETQDAGWGPGDPGGTYPWSDAQLDFLAGALEWLAREWDIPVTHVLAWNGRGVGLHRDFPEWTSSPAKQYPYKQCPGDARTAQFNDLLTVVQSRLLPPPDPEPPAPTGDLMLTRFQCSDADAAFIGLTSGGAVAVAPVIEWANTETDELFEAHIQRHETVPSASFKACTLLGDLPQDDRFKVWSAADFRQHIPSG